MTCHLTDVIIGAIHSLCHAFSALFTPSLPVTKCHTKLPPHYVTPVHPPPKKLGFLITAIRLFTVIM